MAAVILNSRLNAPALQVLPPLSVYIHIPWCLKKCPYCDFNSHEKREDLAEQQYVDCLIRDLELSVPLIWGRRIHTIFFGGGTPSLFSADSIDRILSAVRALISLDSFAEITLEANPGTFEVEKFAAYRQAGINRLSIGIQSFNENHLKALGRVHDGKEAKRAIEIAQKYFDNFNLDLMYALPQQTLAQAEEDIKTAIEFNAPHISAYHLTLEPNTLFYRQPPPLPNEDLAADMQIRIEEILSEHNYQHYETSAFSKPNRQAKHNLNYWQFGDYLGIGAGAHSKISFPEKIIRQARYKQPKEYMKTALAGTQVQEERKVERNDIGFEFMMNVLRLTGGFPTNLFEQRTGFPMTLIQAQLDQAEQLGFIQRDHQNVTPTLKGQRFLNDLLQVFLSENGVEASRQK